MIDATKFRITPSGTGTVVSSPQPAPVIVPANIKAKAVPFDSDKLQIVREAGDKKPHKFTVFFEDTGLFVDVSSYNFILTLRGSAALDSEVGFISGDVLDAEKGLIGFTPSEDSLNLQGFFQYTVEMVGQDGRVVLLAASSYVCK